MRSINLVPEALLESLGRRRRIRTWTALAGSTGVVFAVVGVVLVTSLAPAGVQRERVAAIGRIAADLERQTLAAQRRLDQAAQQARMLLELRTQDVAAAQLARLSELAPEGVMLTRVAARTAAPAAQARPGAAAHAGGLRGGSIEGVELVGVAADHEELTALVAVLERMPHWKGVSLRRVARESFGAGQAIAFQIDCEAGAAP